MSLFVQAILHFILLLFKDMRKYSLVICILSVNKFLCVKTALAVALKNLGKNNDSSQSLENTLQEGACTKPAQAVDLRMAPVLELVINV